MKNKRIKIDFKEKRKLNNHNSNKLDILDYLEIWNASKHYFDSKREFGYGGYIYDNRWGVVVDKLIDIFNLTKESNLLDIGCAKGYLVNDFNVNKKVGFAVGVDISLYPLIKGKRDKVKGDLVCANAVDLPFENKSFEIVFCKDTLHNLIDKKDTLIALKEIERVGKNKWLRVGAYKNNRQKKIIDKWATFATTYLHVDEWIEMFDKAKYTGNYDWFHPSEEF